MLATQVPCLHGYKMLTFATYLKRVANSCVLHLQYDLRGYCVLLARNLQVLMTLY